MRLSPGVFLQSNGELFDELIDAVERAADPGKRSGSLGLELYAGAGFLTRRLARVFDRLIAVESHKAAAQDLSFNLAALGLQTVEVQNASAEQFLSGEPGLRPEVVIPCHYDTFPNQRADIETMQMLAEHMCPNTAIAKVLPGQSLTYHSSRYGIG